MKHKHTQNSFEVLVERERPDYTLVQHKINIHEELFCCCFSWSYEYCSTFHFYHIVLEENKPLFPFLLCFAVVNHTNKFFDVYCNFALNAVPKYNMQHKNSLITH